MEEDGAAREEDRVRQLRQVHGKREERDMAEWLIGLHS